MNPNAAEMFSLFFTELETQGIPYVILHSYQDLPAKVDSDIDYAVRDSDLRKIPAIQAELALQQGWALTQIFQHQVFAYYAVINDPSDPRRYLKLDGCSHYVKDRCFFLRDSELLAGRRSDRGFYIPAPATEFIYVLAKIFGKNKPLEPYLPRLRELWSQDPEEAELRFVSLFGTTGKSLTEWFATPPSEWSRLGSVMRSRNRFGPKMFMREGLRMARRAMNPTGLRIAILGSDGTGKSTLISRLQTLLEPCFRRQLAFHFRPMFFEKTNARGPVSDPHAQPPRGKLASWLKVFYYFLDQWLGHLFIVVPALARSTLVIFDRDFNDLLVDHRRYRLHRSARVLVRMLIPFLPRSEMTFVLDASPECIHSRKPELPIEELKKQRAALQQLASGNSHAYLIEAEEAAENVAQDACRHIIHFLAERERRRTHD